METHGQGCGVAMEIETSTGLHTTSCDRVGVVFFCSKHSVQPWRRSSNKTNCFFSIIVHPNMLCVCHPYKPRSLVLRIDQALHSAVFGTHTLEQPLPVLGTLTPLLDFRTHTLGTPTSGSLEPILGTPTLVL